MGPRCQAACGALCTVHTPPRLHREPSPRALGPQGPPECPRSRHDSAYLSVWCHACPRALGLRGSCRAPGGRRRDRDSGSRGVSQAGASSSAARVSAPRWKGARRPCAQPQPGGAVRPGRAVLSRAPRPAEPRARPPARPAHRACRWLSGPAGSPGHPQKCPPHLDPRQRREGAVPRRGRLDHQPCVSPEPLSPGPWRLHLLAGGSLSLYPRHDLLGTGPRKSD